MILTKYCIDIMFRKVIEMTRCGDKWEYEMNKLAKLKATEIGSQKIDIYHRYHDEKKSSINVIELLPPHYAYNFN